MTGLDGGNGSISGGCHHLPYVFGPDIPRGIYPRKIGTHIFIRLDIAVLHVQHPLEQLGVGQVADKGEQTQHTVRLTCLYGGQRAGFYVFDRDFV